MRCTKIRCQSALCGEIASNLHAVEGTGRGYAKLVDQNTKFGLAGITAVAAE